MKKKLNKVLYRIFLFVSCLYGFAANAACVDGIDDVTGACCVGTDPSPVPCPPDTDIPINENITILIILAVLFGIYIIYNHQQNKKRLA